MSVGFVGGHQVEVKVVGESAVAGAGEVGVVALGEAFVGPADHGAGASHALLLVVKGAAGLLAGQLLHLDHAFGAVKGGPGGVTAAAYSGSAVVGSEDENGGVGDQR